MGSRHPFFFALSPTLLGLATAGLVACSAAATGSGSGGDGDEECPRGFVEEDGECVRGGGGRDTGGGDDADAGGFADFGGDITNTACTPGDRVCVDGTTAAVCSADGSGYTQEVCGTGMICASGSCIVDGGGTCTPGAVLGCADPTSLQVCSADGSTFESRACEASTPNCFGGTCTAWVCEAGRTTCVGDDVVACSADGMSQTVVTTCGAGCSGGECIDPCGGDDKTYVGCGFLAADLDNYSDGLGAGADAQQYTVTVSNTQDYAVNVTVTNGAGSEVATRTVGPGALERIDLPRQDVVDSSLSMNSYRITTDGPVTAHQFNPSGNVGVFSNDASLLLPVTALGEEYIVLGWPAVVDGLRPFVTIIASAEGNTVVNVTPTTSTLSGDGVPGIFEGATQSFTLVQNQVLSLMPANSGGGDLSGTVITADNPIAVFTGSECANIPVNNTYCDHLEEQLIPVSAWGNEYVAAKFFPRGREDDIWRVMAAEPGTTITSSPTISALNGVTLGRGEWREFRSTGDMIIQATGPISIAQFMVGSSYPDADQCNREPSNPFAIECEDNPRCAIPMTCDCTGIGDPAILMSVPSEQFLTNYVVLVPSDYQKDYMTIVAPVGANVRYDGAAPPVTPSTLTGTTWQIYRFLANDGVHTVAGAQPFGLYVYGYDCDVSYAYAGGMNLESVR